MKKVLKKYRKNLVKNFGDRRQEIVFIGLKNQMDENIIKKKSLMDI